MAPPQAAIFSVVSSLFQRDLLKTLGDRPEFELEIYWLEPVVPDSPWPQQKRAPYKNILPCFWFQLDPAPLHLNWNLPKTERFGIEGMDTLISATGQRLMRFKSRQIEWLFSGERPRSHVRGWRKILPDQIMAPLHRAGGIVAISSMVAANPRNRFPDAASPVARDRISCIYFQPLEELPSFFAQADVFILSDRHEGWSIVINQAIGAGLLVICSDSVGSGCGLVEENINGMKFETGNIAGLSDKMQRFVRAQELCLKFGEASRRHAHGWISEKGAEKWI